MKGNISDPDGDDVKLDVEIRPVGVPFSNTPTCTSGSAVASGSNASTTCSDLTDGQYHWQARANDSYGAIGSWLSAGENPESSPEVSITFSNWSYNRKLTITGTTAGAQTNYSMKLTVYKTSGNDIPGTIYLGGNVRDDFGDLRFTNSDGVTLLDYWIESYTSGVSATVWVEVDSIPASPNTASIYVYYGNPSATSASSGTATFKFFDDFESYSIGSNGSSTWTAAVSGWSVQSDEAGGKMMKKAGSQSNSISTIPYVQGNISIDASLKHLDTNDLTQLLVNYVSSNNFYTGMYGYSNYTGIYDMTYGFRATSGYIAPENSWLDVSLIKNGNTLTARTSSSSVSWNASSLGSYPMGIRMGGTGTGAVDNFRIRAYANPEPAWG